MLQHKDNDLFKIYVKICVGSTLSLLVCSALQQHISAQRTVDFTKRFSPLGREIDKLYETQHTHRNRRPFIKPLILWALRERRFYTHKAI